MDDLVVGEVADTLDPRTGDNPRMAMIELFDVTAKWSSALFSLPSKM